MNSITDKICIKLRLLIKEAVKRNLAEGILLSGGLDTSILATIASKHISLKAFTIAFQGAPAPDIEYATLMAKHLKLNHHIHYFNEAELYAAIPPVVKTMKSFAPMEIRNSVTTYIGLKTAKEQGIDHIMTGDGCDELFAGYSFLFKLEKKPLELALQKLWDTMQFSSIPLAQALGAEAKLPYLDPELKAFAINLDSKYKIQSERGSTWGKWIIRKAFEASLPEKIVWRAKTPIEYGSGTTTLPNFFNQKIPAEEFEAKQQHYHKKDKVMIRDKEQLFYYEIYRSALGIPHPTDPEAKLCPQCHSNVTEKSTYCHTCGAYPI